MRDQWTIFLRQIHLNTAVVMMFVVGAFLWANVEKPYAAAPEYTFGWPAQVYWPNSNETSYSWGGGNKYGSWWGTIFKLAFNVAFAVGVVWAAAVFCQKAGKRLRVAVGACLAVYLILWLTTSAYGTPIVSEALFEQLSNSSADQRLTRTSPREFTSRGYSYTDVVVVSSPFPFIIRARMIDAGAPPYDLAHIYYVWFGGNPIEITYMPVHDGLRRK